MYKHQIDFFPSTVSKEMCQVLSIYLACEMWSHPYGTAHRHSKSWIDRLVSSIITGDDSDYQQAL